MNAIPPLAQSQSSVFAWRMDDPVQRAEAGLFFRGFVDWKQDIAHIETQIALQRAELRRALQLVPAGPEAHRIDRMINTPEFRRSWIKESCWRLRNLRASLRHSRQRLAEQEGINRIDEAYDAAMGAAWQREMAFREGAR